MTYSGTEGRSIVYLTNFRLTPLSFLKTLKMHEELSVSFVSCEKESPLGSMPVPDDYKKIQRMIKLDEDQEKSSETISVREQRAFREMTEALRRVQKVPK